MFKPVQLKQRDEELAPRTISDVVLVENGEKNLSDKLNEIEESIRDIIVGETIVAKSDLASEAQHSLYANSAETSFSSIWCDKANNDAHGQDIYDTYLQKSYINGISYLPNYRFASDGIYIKREDNDYVMPLNLADLSTQPSIYPQRFGNFGMKEVLIRNQKDKERLVFVSGSGNSTNDFSIVSWSLYDLVIRYDNNPAEFITFVNGKCEYGSTSFFNNTSFKIGNTLDIIDGDNHNEYKLVVNYYDTSVSPYIITINGLDEGEIIGVHTMYDRINDDFTTFVKVNLNDKNVVLTVLNGVHRILVNFLYRYWIPSDVTYQEFYGYREYKQVIATRYEMPINLSGYTVVPTTVTEEKVMANKLVVGASYSITNLIVGGGELFTIDYQYNGNCRVAGDDVCSVQSGVFRDDDKLIPRKSFVIDASAFKLYSDENREEISSNATVIRDYDGAVMFKSDVDNADFAIVRYVDNFGNNYYYS